MATQTDDLSNLLEYLSDETRPLVRSRLHGLSDLHGEALDRFVQAFDRLAPLRRRHLVAALVELAEASFEVTFDAIFLRSLDDLDEQVRSAAVDGLWENESPQLVGHFLAILRRDPSTRVRASAAACLAHFVLAGELEHLDAALSSRIVSELLAVLHLPNENIDVRRRALESVAYACLPEVIQALEVAYFADDERMRQSAVLGMGRSCDQRWGTLLIKELGSRSPAMRYEAALACGELMLAKAVPGLGRLLHDPDREVAEAAIWALGQTGGERAHQLLVELYDEADEETRSAIDDALAEQDFAQGELDFSLYDLGDDDAAQEGTSHTTRDAPPEGDAYEPEE